MGGQRGSWQPPGSRRRERFLGCQAGAPSPRPRPLDGFRLGALRGRGLRSAPGMFVGQLRVRPWPPSARARASSLGLLFPWRSSCSTFSFRSSKLLGIEKLRIVHGFTAYNPYDLLPDAGHAQPLSASVSCGRRPRPSSRSLRDSAICAPATAGLAAAVLGAAVLSHFLLDVPHAHPRPAARPRRLNSPRIGLALWNHRWAAVAAELRVLADRRERPTSAPRARGAAEAAFATVAFGAVLVLFRRRSPRRSCPIRRATAPSPARALVVYAVLAALAEGGSTARGSPARASSRVGRDLAESRRLRTAMEQLIHVLARGARGHGPLPPFPRDRPRPQIRCSRREFEKKAHQLLGTASRKMVDRVASIEKALGILRPRPVHTEDLNLGRGTVAATSPLLSVGPRAARSSPS